jgi:hypothetical protein
MSLIMKLPVKVTLREMVRVSPRAFSRAIQTVPSIKLETLAASEECVNHQISGVVLGFP